MTPHLTRSLNGKDGFDRQKCGRMDGHVRTGMDVVLGGGACTVAKKKCCTKFRKFKWRYNWAEKFLCQMESKGYNRNDTCTIYRKAKCQEWSEGKVQGLEEAKLRKDCINEDKTECVDPRPKVATIGEAAWRLGWWSSYRCEGCASELHGSYTIGRRDAKSPPHTCFIRRCAVED